jgi:hypothetical protein
MSKKSSGGYKGVDCQSLEKEINGNEHPSPVIPVRKEGSNSYDVVGSCRASKNNNALNIKMFAHYYVISRYDLENIFSDNMSVGEVREYKNEKQD